LKVLLAVTLGFVTGQKCDATVFFWRGGRGGWDSNRVVPL